MWLIACIMVLSVPQAGFDGVVESSCFAGGSLSSNPSLMPRRNSPTAFPNAFLPNSGSLLGPRRTESGLPAPELIFHLNRDFPSQSLLPTNFIWTFNVSSGKPFGSGGSGLAYNTARSASWSKSESPDDLAICDPDTSPLLAITKVT